MEKKRKAKKKVGIIVVITLIILALLIPFVFASTSQEMQSKEKNQFFSVDSMNKAPGSMLEMTVDLGEIKYNRFLFTLISSDKTLENIDTSNVADNTEIEKEENCIVISGNREEMNVNEIKLYYQIPQDIAVGSAFTLKASIEEDSSAENEKEAESTEGTQIEDNIENNKEAQNNKQTIEITITIVEEQKTDTENNTSDKNGQNQNENPALDNLSGGSNNRQELSGSETSQASEKDSMQIGTMQTATSGTRTSSSSSVQGETITYNGSSNNYLEKLVVEGYELNTDFTKENTTYFVQVGEAESSLKITATAEDDEAKVCIYGNEDIKAGSKILIYVTAENGSVRTYRIYVTM